MASLLILELKGSALFNSTSIVAHRELKGMCRFFLLVLSYVFMLGCSALKVSRDDINVEQVVKNDGGIKVYARLSGNGDGKYQFKDACSLSERATSTCPGDSVLKNQENGYVDLYTLKPVYSVETLECNAVGWNPIGRCLSENEFFYTELNEGYTFGSWLLFIPLLVGNSWHFLIFDKSKYEESIKNVSDNISIKAIFELQKDKENARYVTYLKREKDEKRRRVEQSEKIKQEEIIVANTFAVAARAPKRVGDKVCSQHSVFGYIERISENKLQIRQVGKLPNEKSYYFFRPDYRADKFHYSRTDHAIIWASASEWAVCSFGDVF